MKPRIREAIVVEGKHDAIRLRSAVDATVVTTDGFRLFRQPEKWELLRRLAATCGLIVLTDSDAAGFVIRDRISGALPPHQVRHAYAPEIVGKERRKRAPSKEGLLGVEGIDGAVLLQALRRAGATVDEVTHTVPLPYLTKARLYADGLTGTPDSAARRRAVLCALGLPQHLSTNRLLEVLNAMLSEAEYRDLLAHMQGENTT